MANDDEKIELHEPVTGGAFAGDVKAELLHPAGGAVVEEKIMQPSDGGGDVPPAAAVEAVAPSEVQTSAPTVPSRIAWEQWAADKGVPHWKADAARHGRGWPLGQEVTEDEFNQAVYDAFNSRIG